MPARPSFNAHTLRIESPAIPSFNGVTLLEPVRLSGREGVNRLFEYELLLKTPDALHAGAMADAAANINLDELIGKEISCLIELDGSGTFFPGQVGASVDALGAGTRQINALITAAHQWGEEGRHIQYRLVLRPWLYLASLTTDCKIFQNQTPVQIIEAVLGDYAYPVDKRLLADYPQRDYQTQYNETDLQFIERLCQEWGINYHFEHTEGKHRLILSDAIGSHKATPSAAYAEVEYHPPGWKVDAEYLHSVVPQHQMVSGSYTSRDYDYTRPKADLTQSHQDPRPTGHANQEVYQWHHEQHGSHYVQPRAGTGGSGDPQGQGHLLALLRMQALRSPGQRIQASGNLRGMAPGHTFKLTKHPRDKSNAEYLILDTQFSIEDVGQETQTLDAAKARTQQWRVEVTLTGHPTSEEIRPEASHTHIHRKPTTKGPQVALVVGPSSGQSAGQDANIWTDDLGRVKVQFPWDRLGQNNQHSSCWVRVTSEWAGNQLGSMQVPRIGQEVVINFIGGDPDLPICAGRVWNQNNTPPWQLPSQAALSGFRSRELNPGAGNSAAGRSNHLILDDTEGKIQAQLKSDHQASQLSLGYITRIEDNQGRKDPRGEGFELRTDGHGTLRANDGMLLTTEARDNAAKHAKDMGETTARLEAAEQQHQGLHEAAATAKNQSGGEDQADVAKALKAQNKDIKGSGKADAKAGQFPELAEPHLVLSSAAGIAATTPGNIHMQAGEHIAFTSQGHTSLSIGQRLMVAAKNGIRFFALKGGMKWIAGKDKIRVEAHKDKIKVTAKQAVRITSTTDSIYISAPESVTINGGNSYTRWDAQGITHGTLGAWVEHAASHVKMGPDSKPLEPQNFKACAAQEKSAGASGDGSISL